MKQFKRDILLICWFVIFSFIIYSGKLIKIDNENWLINVSQHISLLIVFFNSYHLLKVFIAKKVRVTVFRMVKKTTFSLLFGVNFFRIFFIAQVDDNLKIALSKFSKLQSVKIGQRIYCYRYANKLRVIDEYVLFYRLILIIFSIFVLEIVTNNF